MPAKATKGTCDPAPDPYNVTQVQKGNGDVFVEVAWGWDGVSTIETGCQGPLVGARVTNKSLTTTWYAVFPRPNRPKADPIVITFPPGFTKTYSAAQLSQVGLVTKDDVTNFQLTSIPPN